MGTGKTLNPADKRDGQLTDTLYRAFSKKSVLWGPSTEKHEEVILVVVR